MVVCENIFQVPGNNQYIYPITNFVLLSVVIRDKNYVLIFQKHRISRMNVILMDIITRSHVLPVWIFWLCAKSTNITAIPENFYRPQQSCGKVMFSQVCVKHSVHREGACMVWGMHGRGDMHGSGVCMAGGVHGRGHVWQELCVAGAHAWQWGVYGRGCAWQGVCVVGGPVWQEKWPLQWAVRILLECILVKKIKMWFGSLFTT